MVVYGDLLFLINFSMDFLCFYLCCLLLHRKLPTARACIASCMGGAYSVLALFLRVEGILAFLIDISVLVLMCLCVYFTKESKARQIFRAVVLYLAVSALLGGVMTALFSLFNEMDILADGFDTGEGVDVWVFALLAVVGSVFTMRGGRLFRSSSKREVRLEFEGESGACVLRALVDSGNLATEPISGRSVVFASLHSCRAALGERIFETVSNFSLEDMSKNMALKLRLIPTKSVSGESVLPAIKFKGAYADTGKERKPLDVWVAFVPQNSLGEYDAIISDEAII